MLNWHKYDAAPVAGWIGYVEGDGWTLFVAEDGQAYLHVEGV